MQRMLAAGLTAMLALSLVPLASAQDAQIAGQVLDQDGVPVAGASVWLYQYGDGGGTGGGSSGTDPAAPEGDVASDGDIACDADGTCSKMIRPESYHQASATTDAEGRFSMQARSGWAELSVSKEGYASSYQSVEVDGSPVAVELVKFPDKTAAIQGTVRGANGGLQYVSISAENPQYGVYECSLREGDDEVRPMPADQPVSQGAQAGGGSGSAESNSTGAEPARDAAMTIAPGEPYPGFYGCAITVRADGTFAGNVTPGYTILRFYHDSWRDGGQEYYSVSRVMDLPAGQTTRIDIQLTARPGPDATLGGHVIDKATKQAVPGAQVSFSSQDAYGWANAQTDKDGSYQVKLRSGFTQIHVWADGYFPWEGQVTVRASADGQRFTIELTKGEARWGGCCIAYAEDAKSVGAPTASGAGMDSLASDGEEQGAPGAFQDLGGGLGPYDPAASQDGASEGAPGFGLAALVLGLAAVALITRRR